MLRVGVFVSGGGTNLQALIDAVEAGTVTNTKIALVVSSRKDAFALERSKSHGIPSIVIRSRDYTDSIEYDRALEQALADAQIDLIVLAGFMTVLSLDFIRKYNEKIINVHPALIPSFCGKGFYGIKVHEEALARGVKISGATVHYVNEIVDGGRIIAQKAVEVLPDDTAETLQKRIMVECEQVILPKAVNDIANKEKRG